MGIADIREEALVLHLVHYISTIGKYLVLYAVKLVADDESLEFDTEFLGEFTSFGEEL